jgi:hypothetical protein
VPFEALAMPRQHDLKCRAIAHFEDEGDYPPERSFDQVGVADLFSGREHLAQGPAGIRKL